MQRDVILSIVLHVLIVAATLVASPFGKKPIIQPEDVIRVTLRASLPGRVAASPAPAVSVPQPATQPADKAKAITKPTKKKEQPKPKKRRGVRPGEEASAVAEQYAEREIETDATEAGSPFAGATVDNENFNYPYWFEQAFNKIASNFRYYYEIDGQIVAVVYFSVLRSGRIVEVRVDQPSGVESFDQACIAAIEKSGPFPPFPREFAEEIIGITLPVKYPPKE